MELAVLLQALEGGEVRARGLHRQHGAGLHRRPVEEDGAGPAVGGVTADVGAGQPELIAEEVHQERPRLHLVLVRLAVHRDLDRVRAHGHFPPARLTAAFSARPASTRDISRLYSTEPRRSAEGEAALAASFAVSTSVASSGFFPVR